MILIIDFDGVILDSFTCSKNNILKVATKLNLPFPKETDFINYWGKEWSSFLLSVWPNIDVKLFNKTFNAMNLHQERIPSIEGAVQVLKDLSKKYYLAMVTNRGWDTLSKKAKDIDLDLSLFQFVQAFEDTPFEKPDSRVFNKLLLKMSKMKETKAIFVGDTVHDFGACDVIPEIDFIGVLTGPTKKETFLSLGVREDNLLLSIKELPFWLKS